MQSLNQSLITIVNQGNGKPADGIPGDRASVLGNPFDMQRDERLRDPVCDAYDEYFDTVVAGTAPVPTATRIAKEWGLRLASAWQRPTRAQFMAALAVLEQRQAEGKPSKVMCWCAPSRCHLDKVKRYLDNQRTLQTPDVEFRAMPEAPTAARTQTSTIPTTEVMETNIANSIQLIGQLPPPMLDALAARLETVKASLNADVSNYARGRLNTWIGVQWDLKNKQFIPAGFWDEQLWEFGQRVYPGAQMLLLTYSGDGTGDGTGIGLHRDDSYAKFEARTVSLETQQGSESTWFMRQTYPGMGYVKAQNEAAGVHEFGLPSGSVITFNCKNQHAVEPGTGRWSLNLWQVADKHQAAYRTFVETYGQSGGAVPHRPAGKDLLLPKPLHLTEAQRQQLSTPTVRRVMSVAEFNSRPKTASSAPRERQTAATATQAATTVTEPEPTLYQWSRYAPAGKEGYECSTQGDRRFSALNARLRDGRTIEEAYQLDVKGYRAQGNDWKLGKGKPPSKAMPVEALYSEYKALWQQWSVENPVLMNTLAALTQGKVLTDKFASTPVSQARALAELLNERQVAKTQQVATPQVSGSAPAAPDRITSLEPHQVFVFGSNTEGRHGAGAAKQAVAFGAEYGNPRGRQGQTYAIVTKDLTKPKGQQLRSVPLEDIEQQVSAFLDHANAHPETEFLVTRFGCDLAGYTEQEIGSLWVGKDVPTNVRLPQAFLTVIQAGTRTPAPEIPTEGIEAMPDQPALTALTAPKPYNPLRDLAPLNARVAIPMQKDVAMSELATQFIGRSAAPASTPSSTRNYEREWAKLRRANTGIYNANDVVMVSGSGEFRGVTMNQIEPVFRQHHVPLLTKVVEARATVLLGKASGTDKLVKDWLETRGYRFTDNGGYLRAEAPLMRDKATAEVSPTAPTQHQPTAQSTVEVPTESSKLRVVSGGQTGADFGGLKAGKALGLETGGTAPHGWLVERCARFPNGTNPGLADYGLVEGPRGNSTGHTYILRTELNVQNSDGTLVLGSIDPARDKGSFRTVELAEKHRKPCLHVSVTDLFSHPNEAVLRIKDWALDEGIQTLNVAGNRESKCVGLEDRVETVLKVALKEVVRVRTELEVEQQTNNNMDTMNNLNQVSQSIQEFCNTETFRRAIDPTDFGTPDEMGVGKGGCLMVACALQDSLGIGEVQLVISTDLQEPDEFPVFRHAVVKLASAEEMHYLDGFGLHTEAEFKAKWVTPDEQHGYQIELEPLTPDSLELAVSNQGAYFHRGTIAVLTELCQEGLQNEAVLLQAFFSEAQTVTPTIDHTTPVVIACDGACSGNPGPGGYGTIVQFPDGTEEIIVGNAAQTTNNRMELQGLIAGLQAVYSNSEAALTFSQNPVHVLSDSEMTLKCADQSAAKPWKRKANKDLWQEYDQLPTSRALTFEWVRGHNGHELNERCDKLAVAQTELAKQGKLSEPTAVVPQAASKTEPQSVTQSTQAQQPAAPNRYPTYLSLVNGQLQQHATWAECQAATSGVSGAKFKKVKDEGERTETLAKWGVSLPEPEPTPARYLIYADHECCPQSSSVDVQTKTCLLTQKALIEAQKRGYEDVEIIVATLNDDPVNRECLQPLVAAAQTGVSKAQSINAIANGAPFRAEVYESPDAGLDLLDLQGNPDNRLILISNGKGFGTHQMVHQAEKLGVKVIGYNPEKQEYMGATPPQPAPTVTKVTAVARNGER